MRVFQNAIEAGIAHDNVLKAQRCEKMFMVNSRRTLTSLDLHRFSSQFKTEPTVFVFLSRFFHVDAIEHDVFKITMFSR